MEKIMKDKVIRLTYSAGTENNRMEHTLDTHGIQWSSGVVGLLHTTVKLPLQRFQLITASL